MLRVCAKDSPRRLLSFNRLEQAFEVAFAEGFSPAALDDFEDRVGRSSTGMVKIWRR
jgi:hypothetical protein